MADAGGLMQTAPPTAKGRATRQTILAAAEEVFGELSYDSASIAEITRRAGVAQGTFYVYFPDKRAAFVELVHQLNHDLRKALAIAIADVEDRLSAEGIGLRTFFDYVSQHRSLYRIVRESQFVAPETYEWHYNTLAEGYVRGIAAAQESGEITSDLSADTVAWILMGIAEMLGGRWILLLDRQPPDDVFDEIMCFISSAISQKGADV
jgi:AcrR family transcriptional regulator